MFLLQLSFAYNPAFYSNLGKKLWRHILSSSTCFWYYRKHSNNDNKVCLLPSSSWFQQHFHDWFYVLRYNSDLSKLEWILLLFNFNYIHDLTNRRKLFSIPVAEYTTFHIRFRTLKTNIISLISNFPKYSITLKQTQFASFSYLRIYLPL